MSYGSVFLMCGCLVTVTARGGDGQTLHSTLLFSLLPAMILLFLPFDAITQPSLKTQG